MLKLNLVRFLFSLVFILSLTGCGEVKDNNKDLSNADTSSSVDYTDDALTGDNYHNNTMNSSDISYNDSSNFKYSEREKWKENIEASIDRLDKRIDALEDKADNSSGELKNKYKKQIAELKVKRENLELKLDKYQSTSEKSWDSFKQDIKRAWDDVEAATEKVIDDMKQDNDKK